MLVSLRLAATIGPGQLRLQYGMDSQNRGVLFFAPEPLAIRTCRGKPSSCYVEGVTRVEERTEYPSPHHLYVQQTVYQGTLGPEMEL